MTKRLTKKEVMDLPVAELFRRNAWDQPKENGVEFNVPASNLAEAAWTPPPVLEELPVVSMRESLGSESVDGAGYYDSENASCGHELKFSIGRESCSRCDLLEGQRDSESPAASVTDRGEAAPEPCDHVIAFVAWDFGNRGPVLKSEYTNSFRKSLTKYDLQNHLKLADDEFFEAATDMVFKCCPECGEKLTAAETISKTGEKS